MDQVIELAQQLIRIPSITPEDADCQDIMIHYLEALGFEITRLPCGKVSNFWARYGHQSPLIVFAGHTDVVTAGNDAQWSQPPFAGNIVDNCLYGRGTADMKGALAAMLVACSQFIKQHPQPVGSIGFLITSGEEGDDFNDGTPVVMKYLQQQDIHIDGCILGEPSSDQALGDMIKVGRRGSLTGYATILGKQGHVAYPHLASNPIHHSGALIAELAQYTWDNGNEFFPATTFQFSNIHAGNGAGNVIPGELSLQFNLRYSNEVTHQQLQSQIIEIFNKHGLNYQLDWRLNGEPFFTPPGPLSKAVCQAIESVTGKLPVLSTTGGTSDGRFIAPYNVPVIELGLLNSTIHQVNEHIECQDLIDLCQIYERVLENLLLTHEFRTDTRNKC